MNRKNLLTAALLAPMAALSTSTLAADLTITLTNLTQGIHFTPVIAAAHNSESSLFKVGMTASSELQAMAEGGDISGLQGVLDGVSANSVANPAGGLLNPASSTEFSLTNDDGNGYLSLTAMMLPTNDGFVGLDSWKIPTEPGTYTVWLNAYDAGTEANNELVVDGSGAPGMLGIPAAPGGNAGTNGTGVTNDETNATVHVHRGALGDDMADGGKSDLDNRVHRWLNPVAKLTVTVQ